MIDLFAVDYGDRQELSVAIVREEGSADAMLGPVPYKNGIGALAPLLVKAMPRYTLKEAQDLLIFTHFRNCTAGANSAGQRYPFKVSP